MPSTASPSILAELQAAGENLNTWGDTRLNTALSMVEASGHGLTSHTLTGNVSLTYTNFTATNGTDYVHKIASASDGAYTLTLGGYERSYLIWNASSFDQVIDCSGGGDSVTVYAGEKVKVYCDATNVVRGDVRRLLGALNAGGFKITNLGTPTDNADAVNKSYADGLALDLSGGNLPAQGSGTRGASIVSDGSTANWVQQVGGQRVTTSQTVTANGQPYYADLSGGVFTLTLPASPTEEDYAIIDVSSEASSTNLTVGRNGSTIEGDAEDFTVDIGPRRYVFTYLNSDWKVV